MGDRLTVIEARRILQVGPDTDADELTRRYRRLARVRHPDAGGDPDAFQRLQAAYQLLRDHPGQPSPSERMRRGAAGYSPADPPAGDVSSIDWDTPGDRRRLSRDRLAVRAAAARPVAPVTARSRGPRSLLNPLVPLLSPDLSSSLRITPEPPELGVRLTVRQGRMRGRLLDVALPPGWTRRREHRAVTARRGVDTTGDPRHNAARVTEAALELLDALEWPASAWRLDPGD